MLGNRFVLLSSFTRFRWDVPKSSGVALISTVLEVGLGKGAQVLACGPSVGGTESRAPSAGGAQRPGVNLAKAAEEIAFMELHK